MDGKSGTGKGAWKREIGIGTKKKKREREKIIFPAAGKIGNGKKNFFPERTCFPVRRTGTLLVAYYNNYICYQACISGSVCN